MLKIRKTVAVLFALGAFGVLVVDAHDYNSPEHSVSAQQLAHDYNNHG